MNRRKEIMVKQILEDARNHEPGSSITYYILEHENIPDMVEKNITETQKGDQKS